MLATNLHYIITLVTPEHQPRRKRCLWERKVLCLFVCSFIIFTLYFSFGLSLYFYLFFLSLSLSLSVPFFLFPSVFSFFHSFFLYLPFFILLSIFFPIYLNMCRKTARDEDRERGHRGRGKDEDEGNRTAHWSDAYFAIQRTNPSLLTASPRQLSH